MSPIQSARSVCEIDHGFPEFSIARYAFPSSAGKSDSIRDLYRRISRILSRISMFTGQISSHALQLVHDHNSSLVTRSNIQFAGTVISLSTPMGGVVAGSPVAAITSPVLRTISLGSSGLPVACAGQTEVQRPHIVQASVSSSCFHVKSSITEAPNVSSSVSMRFGRGFIAPLGLSLSLRYILSGDVKMCLNIVIGKKTRKPMKKMTCAYHQI